MRAPSLATPLVLFIFTLAIWPTQSSACGGFFCQTVPINQAGEQIVFRQEGDQTTAMVKILYSGEAENFSWVVPVPSSPEISLGADVTFTELDFATRPQFILQRKGQVCEADIVALSVAASVDATAGDAGESDGVTVEQELSVGPFDIEVVSSDNPDDLAIWLQDNDYDLTDRGRELIAPYVQAGMKFVALKLRRGEQTGSIQPLIMKYQSNKPMVPIRLTAVAAQDDMGVLVWVVSDARAIPENYEHVTPNYTRLNWYTGSFNAYASYQTLVTDAMNETAGGKGFATDYAGGITSNIRESLTTTAAVEASLASLDVINSDAQYVSQSIFTSRNPSAALATLQTLLPLPDGRDSNLYFDANELSAVYTPSELRDARIAIRVAFVERELEPIGNSVKLLPEGAYLTRLYTTMSADEMTLDPTFSFNTTMPEQSLVREALLESSCEEQGTQWTLTLGKGTNREGEVVINANQPVPFGVVPEAVNAEPAAFTRQRTSADAAPELLFQATAGVLDIAADGSSVGGSVVATTDDDNGFFGASGPGLLILMLMLLIRRLRQSSLISLDTNNSTLCTFINRYFRVYLKVV